MTDKKETSENKAEGTEGVQRCVMRRSMVYAHNGINHHNLCAVRECNAKTEEPIKHYYSWQHAKNEGWKYTKNEIFCEPGKDGAWICPACAKEYTGA